MFEYGLSTDNQNDLRNTQYIPGLLSEARQSVFRDRSVRGCDRQGILGVNVRTPSPASVQPAPNPVGLVVNPFLPPLTVLRSTAGGEKQAQEQGQHENQLEKMTLFNSFKHWLKSILFAF